MKIDKIMQTYLDLIYLILALSVLEIIIGSNTDVKD